MLSPNLLAQKNRLPNKNDQIREFKMGMHAENVRNNTKILYRDKFYNYAAIFDITQYDTTSKSYILGKKSIDKCTNKKFIVIKFSESKLDGASIRRIDSLISPYLFFKQN